MSKIIVIYNDMFSAVCMVTVRYIDSIVVISFTGCLVYDNSGKPQYHDINPIVKQIQNLLNARMRVFLKAYHV